MEEDDQVDLKVKFKDEVRDIYDIPINISNRELFSEVFLDFFGTGILKLPDRNTITLTQPKFTLKKWRGRSGNSEPVVRAVLKIGSEDRKEKRVKKEKEEEGDEKEKLLAEIDALKGTVEGLKEKLFEKDERNKEFRDRTIDLEKENSLMKKKMEEMEKEMKKMKAEKHVNESSSVGLTVNPKNDNRLSSMEECTIMFARFYFGFHTHRNYQRTYELCEKSPNDANSQLYRGMMHQKGCGVKKDFSMAIELYRKAVDQGNVVALTRLGYMCEKGLGVKQNYAKACELHQRAADQGYDRGQFNLGVMYKRGLGVKQDYAKACELYQKAADQGYNPGQVNLGVMYEKGLGVKQDYAKACKLYQKAADQGYNLAQFNLGIMYKIGLGVANKSLRKKRDRNENCLEIFQIEMKFFGLTAS